MVSETSAAWDYVIVGSGAGGGTLAARLVESGMRVFLIEAGSDPLDISVSAASDGLPEDYEVPAFHANASENAAISWDFRVQHYADRQQQKRDWKYQDPGVLYPRAAGLGGCTAHNAMIFVLPHDSDWNGIAQLTGDNSWHTSNMRRYAKRLENCHHRPVWRTLRWLGLDLSGHGWNGWLRTERAKPHEAFADDELLNTVINTARAFVTALPLPLVRIWHWMWGQGDPNSRRWHRRSYEGLCYTPMSTDNFRRIGTRERLLTASEKHPGKLHVELDALATRVLFHDDGRASGVEYLKGRHLYRAHRSPNTRSGVLHEMRASREVILCGGAFNTPQLLMLSGIGPANELRKHNIPMRVDLPGVGRNLQDRYEVALTHRMHRPWDALKGARFSRADSIWRQWRDSRSGMYTSNGASMAIVCRSTPAVPEPDLFCMALLARFEGYFSGFAKMISTHHDYLTWVVLKAHTNNRAGSVTLKSADPLDTPEIQFNYFEDGSDTEGDDLKAVVNGIKLVRQLTTPLIEQGLIAEEEKPGSATQSDDQLSEYVRDTAWGHHACGSCAIGPRSDGGVLDSNFRVHGVSGLRVVDASVFPRIPGFFLVSAVYMIGEKAADVILQDAIAH